MQHGFQIHQRRSIRLRGYDYSNQGAYFVTICAQDYRCLFGKIVNGAIILSKVGKMISGKWYELKNRFVNIDLDEFVIMPNHFHGIIIINNATGNDLVGANLCVRPDSDGHLYQGRHAGLPLQKTNHDKVLNSIPKIVQWFKTMATNEYIRNVRQHNWQPFRRHLWQRNYYEHIIRSEKSLEKIREYILNNPHNWKKDSLFVGLE